MIKLNRLFRYLAFGRLQRIKKGRLVWKDTVHAELGDPVSSLKAEVTVHNAAFYRQFMLRGSFGASESYIAGDWDTDNLTALITIILANEALFLDLEKGLSSFDNLLRIIKNFFLRNHIHRMKKNILAHYDLGNNFFSLFLDRYKLYSCANFGGKALDLDTAQKNKLQTICDKLALQPDDHLLDIGCGWGGLAIFAAKNYGCKVTATTISDLQYDYFAQQIEELQLGHRITLIKKDYRQLTGCYDKLVSIEMIEAVGHQYFETFFSICNKCLKRGGLFFLQAITIRDDQYERYKREIDFIRAYIFPGGCLPSYGLIKKIINEKTAMHIKGIKYIGKDYIITLEHWKERFAKQHQAIRQLNFDDKFMRLFYFYFCYCQAGFSSSYLNTVQVLLEKS